ncbi:MAG: NAD-glutamate dehydrogenase [Rhodospirillales bacterium]|nr:NAD-glutamate dehydrogenase [Rhodospirillales bacterium]
MLTKTESLKSELIKKVAKETKKRLGAKQAPEIERFIQELFKNVPPKDLLSKDVDTLFGMAVSLWKYSSHGETPPRSLRVYNPDMEIHGWQSDHTVVEVVVSDKPFLVDSITSAIRDLDLTVHLAIHPVINTVRDKKGDRVETVAASQSKKAKAGESVESYMHLQITAQSGAARLKEIKAKIDGVIDDVNAAVDDWLPTKEVLQNTLDSLKKTPPKHSASNLEETCEFLQWIYDNNFTLLGYREYDFKKVKGEIQVDIKPDSGLGILRSTDIRVFEDRNYLARPLHENDIVHITKTTRKATIHRPVHMDAITVHKINAKGDVVGAHLFLGLFTSVAYSSSPRKIPLLRKKVDRTMDRSGLSRSGHDGKALANILETYPRDELFQISDDELYKIAMGVVYLQDRQRVALFVRNDEYERFVSCLVYVPRDQYTTSLRTQIQEILETAFNGEMSDFYVAVSDSPLARIHMLVNFKPGERPDTSVAEIEAILLESTRSWDDQIADAIVGAYGEEKGQELFRRYKSAFSAGYRERFSPRSAISDIEHTEEVINNDNIGMNLYRPIEADENELRFKVFHREDSIPLSHILPMLENMGLKVMTELPYTIRPTNGPASKVMIHDFGLLTGDGSSVDLSEIRDNFQETFDRVWNGDVENDGFNRLVLRAGLTWRETTIFRAYSRYLRQAAFTFSQSYIEDALARYPEMLRHLVDLFTTQFDPKADKNRDKNCEKLNKKISAYLDQVSNADDDRILRRFHNLVQCTLRTNYYQEASKGQPKPHLSFKLDSQNIDELPLPRPMVEIFVYSPRVEGVHLRGGKVARGGLRWSDRMEDFRTEVLGLVKAQNVKNAVIVPVGSKGGFVVKQPPVDGDRKAFLAEGIECYKTFIRGLLDLTDNLKEGGVVPPQNVVRRDDDDPYLVVAADKGTATFSDIANGISAEYGHWLGDAFASGGSIGYDHKKMGITAKGAWESVKRHFRELGKDIQNEEFTVAGVGDMGGDVFGNGMLLSKKIKLVAAFNHLHIFLDPDPDPAKTFKERQRLFDEVKGWDAYNQKLMSKGGGIFERSAKTITLTPEIQKLLGVTAKTLTPNQVLEAILRSHVELLWFGGIGTYVKSATESHADAGDRANDAIRLNGSELNCKVVGEGANLGVTQLGRIEFGRNGGYINADFIDNSAGVDCSDHEVNIKILLDATVESGDLTHKQRSELLAEMTDEVGELVLRDNYLQSQAISTVRAYGASALDRQIRLIRFLERADRLNREVEFLPNDEELADRLADKEGFTRSEISVLLPYAKIWVFDELIDSDVPDDPYLHKYLIDYFPVPLRKKYAKGISEHRLRREIIATSITNEMANREGGFFVLQMQEESGLEPADIMRAFLVVQDVFKLQEIWDAIEALDNKISADTQATMLLEVNRLIERATLWFLRNGTVPLEIEGSIKMYQTGIADLAKSLDKTLGDEARADVNARADGYVKQGVPKDLALKVSGLMLLLSGCDIVRICGRHTLKVPQVSELYYAIGDRFSLGWMRASAERLSVESHWQKLATTALIEELYQHQFNLTRTVLKTVGKYKNAESDIAKWTEANQKMVLGTERLISELRSAKHVDFSMLSVASRQLRGLNEE